MLNYPLQEKFILILQEFFDSWRIFFCFLNQFDQPYFYFFLVIFIWFFTKQKTGYRLFVLLVFSGYINIILKELFMSPRPMQISWVNAIGYGMPSGGAQSSLVIALFGIGIVRKRVFSALCVFFCLLVSFSRIVLGVHYFTDVIGGWITGGMCYIIYDKIFLSFEEKFFPLRNKYNFLRNLTLLFLPVAVFPFFSLIKLAFVSLGILIGSFCFPLENWDQKTIMYKVGVLIPVSVIMLLIVGASESIDYEGIFWKLMQNLITGFAIFFLVDRFKNLQILKK